MVCGRLQDDTIQVVLCVFKQLKYVAHLNCVSSTAVFSKRRTASVIQNTGILFRPEQCGIRYITWTFENMIYYDENQPDAPRSHVSIIDPLPESFYLLQLTRSTFLNAVQVQASGTVL